MDGRHSIELRRGAVPEMGASKVGWMRLAFAASCVAAILGMTAIVVGFTRPESEGVVMRRRGFGRQQRLHPFTLAGAAFAGLSIWGFSASFRPLVRQRRARRGLAAWAERSGIAMDGTDRAAGSFEDRPLAVSIAYAWSGPRGVLIEFHRRGWAVEPVAFDADVGVNVQRIDQGVRNAALIDG